MSDEANTRELSAGFWIALLLLAAVHVVLTNYFVPLRAVFSHAPLQGVDYDLHIGQIYRVVAALESAGHTWSYDVQLLAGHPEGTITDAGSKAWELWTYLWHRVGVDRAAAFNSFVLFGMWMAPVFSFASARNVGLRPRAALWAAAMTSSLWFFDSQFHWLWFIGMISWALGSCIASLTLSLFYRMLVRGPLRWGIACAVSLSLGLLVHPYAFFALSLPMAIIYWRSRQRLSLLGHASVLAIGASALVVNAYWLINAAEHWHYILNSAFYAQAKPSYLVCDLFDILCSGADSGVIGTRTGFRFLWLGLAFAGLWSWWRARDERVWCYGAGVIVLVLTAYFGGLVPGMQQSQPYRQLTPALLFAVIPAAAFLDSLARERALSIAPRSVSTLVWIAGAALVLQLAKQALYFMPALVPWPDRLLDNSRSPLNAYGFLWHLEQPHHITFSVPHPPMFEAGADDCIAWIEQHVPRGSRMLVEGPVLGERMGWRGHLEVLGGFFERNVQHVDANYFRSSVSRDPTPENLRRYLSLYAVEWVLSNRPEFAAIPDRLQRVDTVLGRVIYRSVGPVSRVLSGGGTVSAQMNRLDIRDSNTTQSILLSYHWHEALRCRPNCQIKRHLDPLDHVGLIEIPAPHPASMTIWNSYQMP